MLQINRVPYLALAPFLQVFLKGQKVGEIAKVILLEYHEMSDRPGQTLEYSIIELRVQADK